MRTLRTLAADVGDRWETATWWQRGLRQGAYALVVVVVVAPLVGVSILGTLLTALVVTVLATGFEMHDGRRRDRRVRQLLGDPDQQTLRLVVLAARRGPAPADPRLRELAFRLVSDDVARTRRTTTSGLLSDVALLGAWVVLALVGSPTFWVAAGCHAAGRGAALRHERRLHERAELLRPRSELATAG